MKLIMEAKDFLLTNPKIKQFNDIFSWFNDIEYPINIWAYDLTAQLEKKPMHLL